MCKSILITLRMTGYWLMVNGYTIIYKAEQWTWSRARDKCFLNYSNIWWWARFGPGTEIKCLQDGSNDKSPGEITWQFHSQIAEKNCWSDKYKRSLGLFVKSQPSKLRWEILITHLLQTFLTIQSSGFQCWVNQILM